MVITDYSIHIIQLSTQYFSISGLPGPGTHSAHYTVVAQFHSPRGVVLPPHQAVLNSFGLVTQNSSIIGMECTVLKVRLQTVNAVYQIVLITIAVDLVHHDWFTVLHDV